MEAAASSPRVPVFPLRLLFSGKWALPTILILLGMAGFAQLGLWQLDRLDQKRAYNAQVYAQSAAPPVNLQSLGYDWTEDLQGLRVNALGSFDYSRQVGLKNQFYNDALGIHLITPFQLAGTDRVIMVDRGWVPLDARREDWGVFDEEEAETVLEGTLRPSGSVAPEERGGRAVAVPDDGLWHRVDLDAMGPALGLTLEPMYLERLPDEARPGGFPRRLERQTQLNEGNHLSYALQWFTFSLILGVGYVILVRRRTLAPKRTEPESAV